MHSPSDSEQNKHQETVLVLVDDTQTEVSFETEDDNTIIIRSARRPSLSERARAVRGLELGL